jgi:flavorubredoxin
VTKKIEEILSFNLPLDMICTSHGVIWKNNPAQIVEKYLEWANNYQENQISIIYDTMWESTRKMAEAIADGINKTDPNVTIKLFNASKEDKNDLITEIFKSKAILMGSSTINNGLLHSIAGLIEMAKGMKFKNKKAVSFGSYGWSGESVKQLNEKLKDAGFEVVNEGIRSLWVPNDDEISKLSDYGKSIVELLK